MNKVETRERINILKAILCVFVLYMHSSQTSVVFSDSKQILEVPFWLEIYKNLITTIADCCNNGFIFISAYLLYKKQFTWKENIIKKIKTLLIPYLLANLLYILTFEMFKTLPLTSSLFGNPNNLVRNWSINTWLYALGVGSLYPYNFATWFLRNLFILNIFATIIKKIIDKYPKISLVTLIIIYLFITNFNSYYIYVDNLCVWCFGYYYVKHKFNIENYLKDKTIVFVYILVIASSTYVNTLNVEYLDTLLFRIRSIVSIFFLYRIVTKYINNNLKNLLLKISTYSFGVYLFHSFLLPLLVKLSYKIFEPTAFMQFVTFNTLPIVCLFILIGLLMLFKMILPKLYSAFMGGRY